jgi:hypothetical protein
MQHGFKINRPRLILGILPIYRTLLFLDMDLRISSASGELGSSIAAWIHISVTV